jgi:hypothetical protein
VLRIRSRSAGILLRLWLLLLVLLLDTVAAGAVSSDAAVAAGAIVPAYGHVVADVVTARQCR